MRSNNAESSIKVAIINPVVSLERPDGSAIASMTLATELSNKGFRVLYVTLKPNIKREGVVSHNMKGIIELEYKLSSKRGLPLVLIPKMLAILRGLEKAGINIVHIYNVTPLAGCGVYKLLGRKLPIVATLNNCSGVCLTGGLLNMYKGVAPCKQKLSPLCAVCAWFQKMAENELPRGTFQRFMLIIVLAMYSLLYKFLSVLARTGADIYIALSKAIALAYISRGYPRQKVIVLPNILSSEIISSSVITSRSLDAIKIAYIGKLSYYKGVDLLIKAFAKLNKDSHLKTVKTKLLIIGSGPLEHYLRKLARKLNIYKSIEFLGFLPHSRVLKLYREISLVVHPARYIEPFSRIILESLAHGIPMVISDTALPDPLLTRLHDTFIFKSGDLNDLIRALGDSIARMKFRAGIQISQLKDIIKRRYLEIPMKKLIMFYLRLSGKHSEE